MPKRNKESDRLLYFQIGITVALALALLVINIRAPRKEYSKERTEVVGLEVTPLNQSTTEGVRPPEIKKTKKN